MGALTFYRGCMCIEWADNKDYLLSKIYDIEGFDYFFSDYLNLKDITDPTLYGLVKTYRKSAEALKKYLHELPVEF
jgi:hypothetical protein